MKTIKRFCLGTVALAMLCLGGTALAVPQWCVDMGGPPCKGGKDGGGGEPIGTNNLSFPVIWSDNVMKSDFIPSTVPWTGGTVGNTAQCVQQATPVTTVPAEIMCYFGEKNLGFDEETGERMFEPPTKTWYLQQRQSLGNAWQAFNVTDSVAENGGDQTPFVVTGVDAGDLMESSLVIKAKQIRIEFTLFKSVMGDVQLGSATDDDYVQYLAFGSGTCLPNDNTSLPPNNCLVAHNMSGAVPGTDQSINEIQGTDYFDTINGGLLVDPQTVKVIKNYYDPDAVVIEAEGEEPDPRIVPLDPAVGVDATVYSACSRLVIQRITDTTQTPTWDSTADGTYGGYWVNGLAAPTVDIAAWNGSYSAEINAGGSVIFGYNWNTKVLSAKGPYRVTFVIEGDHCGVDSNTLFDGSTKSVNVGERRPATVIAAGDFGTANEGGMAYLDIAIGASGGGDVAAAGSTGGGGQQGGFGDGGQGGPVNGGQGKH